MKSWLVYIKGDVVSIRVTAETQGQAEEKALNEAVKYAQEYFGFSVIGSIEQVDE